MPPDLSWLKEANYEDIDKYLHRVEVPSLYDEDVEVLRLKKEILNYLGI